MKKGLLFCCLKAIMIKTIRVLWIKVNLYRHIKKPALYYIKQEYSFIFM